MGLEEENPNSLMGPAQLLAGTYGSFEPAQSASHLFENMALIRRVEEKLGLLVALGDFEPLGEVWNGTEAFAVALEKCRLSTSACLIAATDALRQRLAHDLNPEALFAELKRGDADKGVPMASRYVIVERRGCTLEAPASVEAGVARAIALAEPATGDGLDSPLMLSLRTQDLCDPKIWQSLKHARQAGLKIAVLAQHAAASPGVSDEDAAISADILQLAGQASIPCRRISGIDILPLLDRLEESVRDAAIDGLNILIVEVPRYLGHSVQSRGQRPPSAATREAVDPLVRERKRLLDAEELSETSLKSIEKAIRDRVSSAAQAVRGSGC